MSIIGPNKLDSDQKPTRLDLADVPLPRELTAVARDQSEVVCWDNPVDPRAGVIVCPLCRTPGHPTLVRGADGCFRCNPLPRRRPEQQSNNNPAAAGSSPPSLFPYALALLVMVTSAALAGFVLSWLFR